MAPAAASAPRVQSTHVFVNAPFDEDYLPLLRALLFTIHACGFTARTALEDVGGAGSRLQKIVRLIDETMYSVHDLSRMSLDRVSGLPRFNMPFELGLAVGAVRYGGIDGRDLLVLCETEHQDKVALSDMAGQDAKAHDNTPRKVIDGVRNFLAAKKGWSKTTVGAAAIWERYGLFNAMLPEMAVQAGITPSELTSFAYLSDWLNLVTIWLPDAVLSPTQAEHGSTARATKRRRSSRPMR